MPGLPALDAVQELLGSHDQPIDLAEHDSRGRFSFAASERLALMKDEQICWGVIFCMET